MVGNAQVGCKTVPTICLERVIDNPTGESVATGPHPTPIGASHRPAVLNHSRRAQVARIRASTRDALALSGEEAYYRWLTDVFTPEDIESVKLRRAVFGGYKASATRQYLRQIAWELSRVLHERGMFEEESRRFQAQLLRYERREELESATRGGVHDAAREILAEARRDAELILRKAYKQASEIRTVAEKEAASLVAESNELEEQNSTMRKELRAMLTSVLEALGERVAETPNEDHPPVMDDLRKAVKSAATQTVSELNPERDGGWASEESEPAVSAEDDEKLSGDERVA